MSHRKHRTPHFYVLWLLRALTVPITTYAFIFASAVLHARNPIVSTPTWHDVMSQAIQHHPDIQTALIEYQRKKLLYRNEKLQWMPTLSPTSISKSIKPNGMDTRFDFVGIQSQTSLDWHLPHSTTSIHIQGTQSLGDHELTFNTKTSINQPIWSKSFAEDRLKWNQTEHSHVQNALDFRDKLQETLLKTSKLYNEVVQLTLDVSELQASIAKHQQEKKQLITQVNQGSKPQNDLNIQEISILQEKLDLLSKQSKLKKKNIELFLAIGSKTTKTDTISVQTIRQGFHMPKRLAISTPKLSFDRVLDENKSMLSMEFDILQFKLQQTIMQHAKQPALGLTLQWDHAKHKDSLVAGINLAFPLDQRSLHYTQQAKRLSHKTKVSQWLETCKQLFNEHEDLHSIIQEQQAIIQLEMEKLLLEEKDIAASKKLYESGRVSKSEYNKKQSQLLSSKTKLQKSIATFLDDIDRFDAQSHQFITRNRIPVPKAMQVILSIAERQKSHVPRALALQGNCDAMLAALLKK